MDKKKIDIKEIFNTALQHHKKNNFEVAENLYKKILKIKPDHFGSIFYLGTLLAQAKRFHSAKPLLYKAIQINPNYVDAYNNLGNLLKELGETQEAKKCYEKAILIYPNFADSHNNLGAIFQELKDFKKARSCYEKAIEIQPHHASAYNNLGIASKESGEFQKAIDCYQKSIKIHSDNAYAYYNLGIVYKELRDLEKSNDCFQKAIQIKPNYIKAHNNLLFTLLYFDEINPSDFLSRAKEFRLSLRPIDDNLLLKYQFNTKPKKLKIGFVSGDFKQHPVGFFLLDILKHLQKNDLEIIAYSNTEEKDILSTKLKSHFVKWYEIKNLDNIELINQIRKDGIHILVDLSGHTKKNRLPIFINRPAPIQASWMGYLATTGMSEIDYIIGDPYVTPKETANQFTEKIYTLPNIWCCFSVPEYEIKINEPPVIKNGHITFGSFNNLSKISSEVISLWSKILKEIPKSKIFLKNKQLNNPYLNKAIIDNFKRNDIKADAIILEGSSPRSELLASYNRIDITLDPFPYSGGTTSFESTWMGTPIITKKGLRFVSRSTESVNHNVDMLDWIAKDENEYVKKAIKFSTDIAYLSKIKMNLRQQALKSPLFNTPLFAKQLNNAFWDMWNNFISKN